MSNCLLVLRKDIAGWGRGTERMASLALQETGSSGSRLQGQTAVWLRVPEARAVLRSAHPRALLAAAARGRSGVSARPPCGAGSRAQDSEVSEAPRRRVSGTCRRAGAVTGCRYGPGVSSPHCSKGWGHRAQRCEFSFGAGGGVSGGVSSGDLAPVLLRMRAVARPELAGKRLPPSRKGNVNA